MDPQGRQHVHMACTDDVILNGDPSASALQHVPAGRGSMIILAFTPNNARNIKMSGGRRALADRNRDPQNVLLQILPMENVFSKDSGSCSEA